MAPEAPTELELYRALVLLINVVQIAILAAILRWVRGNGDDKRRRARDDQHDQIARYLREKE